MSLLSKRHRRALADGELSVDLGDRLRTRLWRLMDRHSETFQIQPDPGDNWTVTTDSLSELQKDLLDTYGLNGLVVEDPDGIGHDASFESWFGGGPAYGALDAVDSSRRGPDRIAAHPPSTAGDGRSPRPDALNTNQKAGSLIRAALRVSAWAVPSDQPARVAVAASRDHGRRSPREPGRETAVAFPNPSHPCRGQGIACFAPPCLWITRELR